MDLSELMKEVDIVEYIGHFVELEQRGDEFWGLSPFKEEKTPSFSVRRESGSWYDFSSGLGGNLFTFIKHYNRCSSTEAVEIIKKYANYTGDDIKIREKLTATKCCRLYTPQQMVKKQCTAKILQDNYMENYETDNEKRSVWRDEGISDETMDKFQVCYDSFSNRIVYPIRNTAGKIVNIGGRALDSDWKEKGQRKYCYFYKWGTIDTLYGLSENIEDIKKSKEIIIFEGCKSVLLAYTWGIKNAAAILTSHLNPAQMKVLVSLGCRVVFALDKDVNIKKDRNIEKLKRYVNVEYIFDGRGELDDKDSPVDKGKEVFCRLYDERKRYR